MDIRTFMNLLNSLMASNNLDTETEIQVDVPDESGYFEEMFYVSGVTVNNNGSIALKLFKPTKE